MNSFVPSHLKDMNRLSVYRLIAKHGEISRAEISRQTGISVPTVLKIANFLVAKELVLEIGEGSSPIGRKPGLLKYNDSAYFSLGIELEGDFLTLGVVDLLGRPVALHRRRVRPDLLTILESEVEPAVEDIIRESGARKDRILGLGLGIPGVIDPFRSIIGFAPLVGVPESMDCEPYLSALGSRLGFGIWLDNDVNLAAFGEYVSSGSSPSKDLLYVSLGTGLGAGVILDGKLRRGPNFSAGEIGYMGFSSDARPAKNHVGWVESRINSEALQRRFPELGALLAAYQDDAPAVPPSAELVAYVAGFLGLCISNIVAVLDIERVVLGGTIVNCLGGALFPVLTETVTRLSIHPVQCLPATSGESGVIGAASLVTEDCMAKILED